MIKVQKTSESKNVCKVKEYSDLNKAYIIYSLSF
jgi:hypothetical protein